MQNQQKNERKVQMPYEHLDCKQQHRSKQNAVALRGSAGFINTRGSVTAPPLLLCLLRHSTPPS